MELLEQVHWIGLLGKNSDWKRTWALAVRSASLLECGWVEWAEW